MRQEHTPISSHDVLDQIVSYLNKIDERKSYAPSNVHVEIYNYSHCKFVPLVKNELDDQCGKRRIRCIIQIQMEEPSQQKSQHDGNASGEQILLLTGRYFNYDPNGIDFAGTTLIVKEESNNKDEDGTGLNVWDGSLLLARYLEKNPSKVRGKSVLELGSGPGLVGIAAAILGSKVVILSDLSYALPLMKRNVEFNKNMIYSTQCETIDCVEINWFSPPDRDTLCEYERFPQVILIADCVWLEDLVTPLIDTVEKYYNAHTKEVIMTYQRRGKAADLLFW
eukprot:CAMPEP_0176480870 /NCGR_PEP_ID=MMETSP0200_2-20121128/2509_1 /TAXON_ID=947934 /ORGANISM="Chaetoceros sp., Strain GSL56" /LENGTH=279 /DNA_ID=CAMNT_0017877021 /DNA_START=146 /DNA_END=982 /DNA_ORIENTATION=-